MSEEKVILENDNAFVSTTRVILNKTTYSTANITSVSKHSSPPQRGCASLVAGVFILLAFVGLWEGSGGAIVFFFLIGLVAAWLAFTAQSNYMVKFQSSSGEIEALGSFDEATIDEVINAVNEAIIARG